ncbi:14822_t:CDS:2 [Funneliformis mosseae]|uniref:14822_t:CDS:1 n=1 Tax=Funneliformis mosseae TaxID=27381 RepID=A0A9N9H9E0_FUNMO|nr:14822_t:CDS:2 [Funneliformis mosseae]
MLWYFVDRQYFKILESGAVLANNLKMASMISNEIILLEIQVKITKVNLKKYCNMSSARIGKFNSATITCLMIWMQLRNSSRTLLVAACEDDGIPSVKWWQAHFQIL